MHAEELNYLEGWATPLLIFEEEQINASYTDGQQSQDLCTTGLGSRQR
jgi:hypothetical protein